MKDSHGEYYQRIKVKNDFYSCEDSWKMEKLNAYRWEIIFHELEENGLSEFIFDK